MTNYALIISIPTNNNLMVLIESTDLKELEEIKQILDVERDITIEERRHLENKYGISITGDELDFPDSIGIESTKIIEYKEVIKWGTN